jgi:imidazolonepropionase
VTGLLVEGASGIATLAGGLRRGGGQGEAGVVSGGALAVACWEGRILAVGAADEVNRQIAAVGLPINAFRRLDARGGLITPGLVDAHTHLLFAGTREGEWQLRAGGAGYLEVLAAGGGILSTVAATRAASDEELLAGGRTRLAQMLANGTTTAEAKSGYALDVTGELRLLELTARLGRDGPVELVPTFLGAHAVPAEFRGAEGAPSAKAAKGGAPAAKRGAPAAGPNGTDAYVASVIDEQLPAVARQGIARFCDVFCERGVFSADQSRRILRAAAGHGLGLRLHADELAPSGGAELAAELGAELATAPAAAANPAGPAPDAGAATRAAAVDPTTWRGTPAAANPAGRGCLSVDHLAAPSEEGIAALARAAAAGTPVVATLLPATSWFLGKHHFAPARRFIDAGIPVALASDLNPGTSPTLSLPLVMSIACVEMGLTPAEALVAVTINAAHSLGLDGAIGSIEPGKQADLVVWDVRTVEQIPYWLGARLARIVVKRGQPVFERA